MEILLSLSLENLEVSQEILHTCILWSVGQTLWMSCDCLKLTIWLNSFFADACWKKVQVLGPKRWLHCSRQNQTVVHRSEYLFDVTSEKFFEMKVWGRKNFIYDWLSTYLYVPGVLRLAGLAFRLAGARPTVVTKRNHTLGRLYWEFGSHSSFFSASHCRMPTQCPWYHSEHFSQPM